MNKNQEREDFRVYGILSVEEISGKIELRKVQELVAYHLQLDPYYDAIYQIMEKEFGVELNVEKCNVEIQTIYKAFAHTSFYQLIPKFLNNRTTESNVKICKVGLLLVKQNLLSMKDIKMALSTFFIQEIDYLATGLPFNSDILSSLLWQFNKTISRDILETWMQKAEPYLEYNKGEMKIIQAHEFLFLVVNCVDRMEYFKRTPAPIMDRTKEPKFNRIYKIDSKSYGLENSKNPDERIQTYMKYQYDSKKMIYEGRPSEMERRNENNNLKRKQHFANFNKSGKPFKTKFKTLLNDMQLYEEIQVAKKNAKKQINLAKLNGQRQQLKRATIAEELNLEFTDGYEGDNYEYQGECNTNFHQQPKKSSLRPQTAILKKKNPESEKTKIEQLRQTKTYQTMQQERPLYNQIQQIKEEVRIHREMMQDPQFKNQILKNNNSEQVFRKRPETAALSHKKSSVTIRPSTAIYSASNRRQSMNSTQKGFNKSSRPQSGFFSNTSTQVSRPVTGSVKNQTSQVWKLNKLKEQENMVQIQTIPKEYPYGDGSQGWNYSTKIFQFSNIVDTKFDRRNSIENLNLVPEIQNFDGFLKHEIHGWEKQQKSDGDDQIFVPYGNVKKNNFTVKVPLSAKNHNLDSYKQ